MLSAHETTIAALSTPAGESGIAVVRVSGSESLRILALLFRTKDGKTHSGAWEHRHLYHGFLCGTAGAVIDEVVCAVMRAPESYTGEDTVEISSHGSTLLVSRILEAIFACGARAAEPGEFTKRAFLNGKLDLIQAEAVIDLIHARSELQQDVAREQLAGALSHRINTLADELLELLGVIEANIDFIEEGIDTIDYNAAISLVGRHRHNLDTLLASSSLNRPFREGYRVVFAGPVNAGKSSLFNRMIGENRAIVTEIPGTTRDVLREPIILEGLLFILQDTAGLRGTTHPVEILGVDLAESTVEQADLVLFVIDGSEVLSDDIEGRLRRLDPEKTLIILNKIDLPAGISAGSLEITHPDYQAIPVSARAGDGICALGEALVERVGRQGLNWIARERVVLNSRLVSLLKAADERLGVLETGLENRAPLEILSADAREALSQYETATGRRYTDDLLDTIFSRFCIGK